MKHGRTFAPGRPLFGSDAFICYDPSMRHMTVIDGNNLIHAMHAHAPVPHVGRETLVRILERWARGGDESVAVVFDGPAPHGPMSRQMVSKRIEVRFSGSQSADDVIVSMIHRERDPNRLLVVTDDTAIRHEARLRRCRCCGAVAFIAQLFPVDSEATERPRPQRGEKPIEVTDEEKQEWLDLFDDGDDDGSFDTPNG